jgi:hypothetical protein
LLCSAAELGHNDRREHAEDHQDEQQFDQGETAATSVGVAGKGSGSALHNKKDRVGLFNMILQ